MRFAKTYTRTVHGISANLVTVETHVSGGLPGLHLVGLAETTVKESRLRVKSAIINSGFEFPARRIVVNLAPAHLPKEGCGLDLPIAISILMATGQLDVPNLDSYEFCSELSLSGELRGVPTMLPIAIAAHAQNRALVVAPCNEAQAAQVANNTIWVAKDLKTVCQHLIGAKSCAKGEILLGPKKNHTRGDMNEIHGQQAAKKTLEIAAAGGHHVLMVGPPGTGKSMLAARFADLLPPLSESENLDVQCIYATQAHQKAPPWGRRPFRAPHHTASSVALSGGGHKAQAGEITLAHHGVLFLDELPEFQRNALEILRQPLELGHIDIARAPYHVQFPAQFQLIAAMNPCPCGYWGHPTQMCECGQDQIKKYQQKISGPLLDRIDLQVHTSVLEPALLVEQSTLAESSAEIRARVLTAHQMQLSRQNQLNARLSNQQVHQFCKLSQKVKDYMQHAAIKLSISARGFYRIIKVARTVADLQQASEIAIPHVSEALVFRQMGINLTAGH